MGAFAGVFSGLKVLDLSQAMAGPFCTMILADHGADVVKVENPGGGDLARGGGPFHPADIEGAHSSYFHSINRNKRSIVIDLKSSAGRELLLEMVPQYDVIVENFRAGVMDRLGLSYEVLHARNSRLVYAAVRGFGDPRTGESPYVNWPAFDVVAQAMGGIVSVTGSDPENPTKVGPGIGDSIAALFLCIGILGAVMHVRETGEGQFVDVAMVDAILAVSERIVNQWSFLREEARPEGNHQPLVAPFGIYPARDGSVALAAPSDKFFRDLCRILDITSACDDPRFKSLRSRGQNRHALIRIIAEQTSKYTKAQLHDMLGGIIPFGPVYTNRDIFGDPHFRAREMLAKIECDGLAVPVEVTGTPIKFTSTPAPQVIPGPNLGQHTRQVLSGLGYSLEEIDSWLREGVVK